MVKLRLMRLGRKKRPFYRIVAADVNSPRSGGTLDQVGVYDPLDASVKIDEEAAVLWLNRGAQMTPTVKALLHSQGVLGKWKGFDSTAREDALTKDKPKRRKKLASAAAAPPAAEVEETAATEEPTADEAVAPESTTEAAPEATAEEAPEATAEEAPEATAEATPDATAEEASGEDAPGDDGPAEAAPAEEAGSDSAPKGEEK